MIKSLSAALLAAITLSACIPTANTRQSQQDAALGQALIQAKIQQMSLNTAAPVQHAPQAPAAPVLSETALAEEIAALPSLSQGVNFTDLQDGFAVDGQVYLDPEGQIVKFGKDYATGDVSYLVRLSNGNYRIKYTRVGTQTAPIILAEAQRQTNNWGVTTRTGKNLTGDRLTLTSQGFIVARNKSAFDYQPGKGIHTFAAVDGFHIANLQNGDTATTGYILLERDPKKESLVGGLKSLGNSFGIGKADSDYMLVNIKSGKSVPLAMTLESKKAGNYSGCSSRGLYNKCAHVEFRESLYEQNGLKNHGHYYWRARWFNTPDGPILVVKENGLKNLNAINLKTGKKVNLFTRALGINSFEITQDKSGVLSLVAQLGFSKKTIPDVAAAIASGAAI